MKSWIDASARFVRGCLSGIFSVVIWTFWLGLVVLLVFQLYIISANELSLPAPVLRQFEARLAEAGVRATFGRTSFDPAGRVLIENVRLSSPAFADPIVTLRSVFVRLNLWMLMVGRIEPREIRLTDVTVFVPAMLSPTGRPQQIIDSVDATLEPGRRAIVIHQLSGRVAGVPASARGTVMLLPSSDGKPPLESIREFIDRQFAPICRQALVVAEQVAPFDSPLLRLEFSPSESGATAIDVLAIARSVKVEHPFAIAATNPWAATRLLLFGDAPPSNIEFSASEILLPGETRIAGVHARIVGRLRREDGQFDLREVALTADAIGFRDIAISGLSARIFPRSLPKIETHAIARVLGAPLTIRAEGDFKERQGVVNFEGSLSPRALDVASRQLETNVRKYFDFETFAIERGEARFDAGGKFEHLSARIRVPRIQSHGGIALQDLQAELEVDPERLYAPRAFVRVGENFAGGSYEHEFKTNRYRFLLEGRMRPLAITGWFRDWWKNLFQQFEFPSVPPFANVDVRGSWRDGRQSNVFVFFDTPKAVFRGTELDRLRTRLFVRPAYVDGLEALAVRGSGNVHGHFTYNGNPSTFAFQTLDVGVNSTLDLAIAAKLLGPAGAKTLAPFRLAQPPQLKLRGRFSGADAPGGANDKLRIEARTVGDFHYHDFPLQDVSFIAAIDRDEIVLDDVEALFAGGKARGHARVWGAGEQRRLGFDFALEDAALGKVAAGLNEFFAAKKGEPPAPPGKFVQEKANVRLEFAASAEGRYTDALSYHGEGSAVLRGAEIGEVPLLGTLSELLKFTALRFTEARGNFKIEGSKLSFPEVTLRGANSAIDAHGTYFLDRRELEFNAKLFPFQESENLLKTVVGAVLTPFSKAFEVKLTGSLTKPQWAFVIGPTNLIRALSPITDTGAKPEPVDAKESQPVRRPGN